MTTIDKNEGRLDWPALLFINRLLWLGLSGWLLTRADQTLSFPYWLDESARWAVRWPFRRQPANPLAPAEPVALPILHRRFAAGANLYTVLRLAWADARWLVRQPAVLVGLGDRKSVV